MVQESKSSSRWRVWKKMNEENGREGVSKYNGNQDKLPLYKEKAMSQYALAVAYHKSTRCEPRLRELSLKFLEEQLSWPSLVEVVT